jgi:Xaa-Pro aminopeptidase
MRYEPFDPAFFSENRARLMSRLPAGSLAILHAHDILPRCADGTWPFYQNSDLFYLTGVEQEETVLVLRPGAERPEDRERLFVRETSDLIRIWEGDRLTREEAAARSGIARVEWTTAFEPALRRWLRDTDRVFLNANEHPRAHPETPSRDDRFRERLQRWHPDLRYERLAPHLHALREIKSPAELAAIRTACGITADGFRHLLGFVRPGVTEFAVEAELLREFQLRRSRGFAYVPIVASGGNACVLHYVENDGVCRDGDLLLLDVAAEYGRYNADLTRTIPVNGRFTPRQRAVYEAVLRVYRRCITDLLRPGVDLKLEYQPAVGRVVETELVALGLLDAAEVAAERARDGTPDEVKEEKRLYRKYFMHGTSHSLGLDVHDVQCRDRKVKEGMVFTVEPGIYVREENLGVRLETEVVVRASGNEDLMPGAPIDPDEIERLMAAGRA